MSNYKLTRKADHDLVSIWEYTNRSWGKKQAKKYLNQLEEQFLTLAIKPGIGKFRNDLISSPQSYHCGRHIIFYRKVENGIEILRVLHDSMDFPRHFK